MVYVVGDLDEEDILMHYAHRTLLDTNCDYNIIVHVCLSLSIERSDFMLWYQN